MEMTEEEIIKSYQEAKYPSKQLKILAELNLTTPDEIGRIVGHTSSKSVRNTKWALSDADREMIAELWRQGASAQGIATRIGRPEYVIRDYVSRHRDKCPRRMKHITEGQTYEIQLRHKRGESIRTIANALGISVYSVHKQIKKYIGGTT